MNIWIFVCGFSKLYILCLILWITYNLIYHFQKINFTNYIYFVLILTIPFLLKQMLQRIWKMWPVHFCTLYKFEYGSLALKDNKKMLIKLNEWIANELLCTLYSWRIMNCKKNHVVNKAEKYNENTWTMC